MPLSKNFLTASTSQILNNSNQGNTILLASSSQPASPASALNSNNDANSQNAQSNEKNNNCNHNNSSNGETSSNSGTINSADNFLSIVGTSGNLNGLAHSHSTPNLEGKLFNRIDELTNYGLQSYTFYALPCSSYQSFYGASGSDIGVGGYSPSPVSFTASLTPTSYFPFVFSDSELNSYQYFVYDSKFVTELREIETLITNLNSSFSTKLESAIVSNQRLSYAQVAKHALSIPTSSSTVRLARKPRFRRQSTSSIFSPPINCHNARRHRRTITDSTYIKFDKEKRRESENDDAFTIASNFSQLTDDVCVFENSPASPSIKLMPVLNFARPSYAQVAAAPLNSVSSSPTLKIMKRSLSPDSSVLINELLSLNLSSNSFYFPSP